MKRRRRRKNPSAATWLAFLVGGLAATGAAIYFVNKKQVAAATKNASSGIVSTSTSAALPTSSRPADLPLNVGVQTLPAGTVVSNPDGTTTTLDNATNTEDLANAVTLGAAGGIEFGSTWPDPSNASLTDTLLSDGTVSQLAEGAS